MGRETTNLEPAARRMGISRWLAYEEARTKGTFCGIPLIRAGERRYLVPTSALDRMLAGEGGKQAGAGAV